MKRLIFLFVIIFLFASSIAEARHRPGGVTFNYFYSSLRSYGEWIEIDYDVYAWKPAHAGRHWAPYKTGRWIWSDYGWYWDSYEPYGWAVYHYGRWYFDDYYGWIWIPDNEWGPAWVEWRYDDDYIGWSPLPPYAVFDIHIGIRFTNDWHFPHNHWHYVKYNHFTSYDVDRYYVPDKYKYRIHSRSKHRNDYDYRDGRVFNKGIDRDIVERRSGSRIVERNLTEVSRLRDNDGNRSRDRERVEIFRPGDDEVRKSRDIDKFDIKRSDRRSSLDVSKVELRSREQGNRERDEKSSEVKRNNSNERQDRVESNREDSRRPDVRNIPERKVENSRAPKVEERSSGSERRKIETTERPKVEQNRSREEKREVRSREEKRESPRVETRERREPERKAESHSRNEKRESSRSESRGDNSNSHGSSKERTRR